MKDKVAQISTMPPVTADIYVACFCGVTYSYLLLDIESSAAQRDKLTCGVRCGFENCGALVVPVTGGG
jgi:hypothetical protein